MFAAAITANPTITIAVCHESSFTHNYLIHSHRIFQAQIWIIYLDYPSVFNQINYHLIAATFTNCLRKS
jgi:hypothetical protein